MLNQYFNSYIDFQLKLDVFQTKLDIFQIEFDVQIQIVRFLN